MVLTSLLRLKWGGVLLLAAGLVPGLARAQSITYAGPLVITQGGTYSGNYQSLTSGTPCVVVNTTQPVVLDGCYLQGAGTLIQSGTAANLTVRNCRGQGLPPTVDGQPAGHFLDTYQSQSLVVEHNLLTGTTGITVNRWTSGGGTLTVRYNQARNIDGRWRNNSGSTRSSFLQLNTVTGLAGVEIAYNEVINTPNQSLVEDNINFYNSSGTAGSPIRVHDNFVRGAYPYPATAATYTGTGLTTDGDATTLGLATGYIEANANQFVGTCNAAMNIAAGHDVYYHDNRLVTSALLPDGTHLNATYAATAIFNYYALAAVFFNNRVANNTIGYVKWGGNSPYPDRQDLSPGNCAACAGTVSLPNPITLATEDNEYTLWQQKVQQASVTLGPLGATTTPAAPTAPAATSTIVNPGFEADNAPVGSPTGWQTTTGGNTGTNADYTEIYPGAHSGTYHGTHYRPEPYEVYTYQVVKNLPNGTYTLSAWVKSSGGQNTAQLLAKNYGGATRTAAIAATGGGPWVQVSVPGIVVSNGQCELGMYSNANAGNWLYFDDFTLTLAAPSVPPTVSLTTSATALTLGQALQLSATAADANGTVAKVEFFAGTTSLGQDAAAPYQLGWTPAAAGTYALTAVATDNSGATTTSAAVALVVSTPAPTPSPASVGTNLVANPSFEADNAPVGSPTGWQTTTGGSTNANADYTETYPGARTGTYHLTHYRPEAYEVYTYQVATSVPNGTYSLTAWVKSSGGQNTAQLLAKNYGGATLTAPIAATGSGDWVLVEIDNILVSNGQCELGVYSNAPGGQWLYVDDVALTAQATAPAAPAAPTTAPATTASNTVLNPSFDDDQAAVLVPRQWSVQASGSTVANASYVETYPGAHSGTYHGTHYRPEAYEVYTYQVVKNLPNGTYTLSAWVQSSGGQNTAQLQATSYGGPTLAVDVPATALSQWVQVSLLGVIVSNGQCELGFHSNSPGHQWLYFDDVALVRQATSTAAASAQASSTSSSSLFPNPADTQTTLTVTFSHTDAVTITLFDAQGAVAAQYQRTALAGDNQFSLPTGNLPSGPYTVQVASSSQATQVLHLAVAH